MPQSGREIEKRKEGREKRKKRKRKHDTIRKGFQWRNNPGGARKDISFAAMQQFGRNIEWWEQRWKIWSHLQNLQDPLDRIKEKCGDWVQCDLCVE